MSKLASQKDRIFSRKDVFDELQDIVDITEREISYWTDLEIIIPDIANPRSQGKTRFYSLMNVIDFAVVKRLLEAGLKLEFIKKVMDFLRLRSGSERMILYLAPYMCQLIISDQNTDKMEIWTQAKPIPKEFIPVPGVKFEVRPDEMKEAIEQLPLTISGPFETLFAFNVKPIVQKIIGIEE